MYFPAFLKKEGYFLYKKSKMKYFENMFQIEIILPISGGACWDLNRTKSYCFPSNVCVVSRWVGLSGCLLTDVDEVARGFGLAGYIGVEISVDAVLQFAVEGLVQQSFEILQTMRVVGQTEFTGEDKKRVRTHKNSSKH